MDRICRSLVVAGYQVSLVGRLKPDSLPLSDKPYQQIRLPIKRQSGKGFYAEYNYALWKFLKKGNWDAINAVDLDTIVPAVLASRKIGAKLVYDAHEYFSETPEVVNRPAIKKIWETVASWGIPKADLCYTVGPMLADIFSQRYKQPFGIVRNVPLKINGAQTKANKTDSASKILLYQGMLNQGRGLETATAALRQLPQEYILWLIGSGDIEDDLRSSNVDLVAEGRLVFHGFIPGNQLAEYTQKAWLGLNLLDAISPSYYYSLANKCFDYIQCGLPSIQMNFPEYTALQKSYQCFGLLNQLDAGELAKLILEIGQQPEHYQQLAIGNQKAAQELHWEAEEQELIRLWEQLGRES